MGSLMGSRAPSVGADIVDIERMARALRRAGFEERCFTARERRYCRARRNPPQHFAARFAAKEALVKAIGRRVSWQDVEIQNERLGRPGLMLRGRAKQLAGGRHAAISLAHCDCHAMALVILCGGTAQ
jgi:holo-[acyl-carrier protein] synthase